MGTRGFEIEPIIGLEVHVQLRTRTKLFCACAVEFGAAPNTRVCPVCLGLPGALPVLNRGAIELAVRAGLALGCEIAPFTKWDRKNYFYPDLPKGYQISQYDLPLCTDGRFDLPAPGGTRGIRIRRAHLEEDAGKNVHDFPGATAVDLNRAGTPLLEIVTEPDLRSADEVRDFAVQLQRLVAYLDVSEANMQMGQMRFEPNINVLIRRDGAEFRTPIVEVKNLNSFRSVHGAVTFEIERQVEAWLQDGRVAASGNKENRGWDDEKMVTLPQREKEEASDYRYFPDPDLLPVALDRAWIESVRAAMPELPLPRTERFIREYGIGPKDAPALVDDRATADLLDAAAAQLAAPGGRGDAGASDAQAPINMAAAKATLGKQFLSFWSMHANARGTSIAGLGIPAGHIAELAMLVASGRINATAAAQIAEHIVHAMDPLREPAGAPGAPGAATPPSPADLAQSLGLLQTSDAGQIEQWVTEAFAANLKAVQDALGNPKKLQAARGFLTGQVMKLSGGKADPKIVSALIEKRLGDESARA